MFDSRELRARRSIAWERAKAEIQDILGQFWGLGEFEELDQLVREFAEKFEALAHKGLPGGVEVLAKNAMPKEPLADFVGRIRIGEPEGVVDVARAIIEVANRKPQLEDWWVVNWHLFELLADALNALDKEK